MTKLLLKLPWFLAAPAVVAVVLVLAAGSNYVLGDYFERTFLDEANPLLGAGGTTPASGATAAAALAEGQFRDGDAAHNGSGTARIIRAADGGLTLRFENFSVTNGPDLFVILSAEDEYRSEGSLDLGELRATDGNVNYSIPAGTDVSRFRSVVIWCRQFRVTFAVAPLGAPGAQRPADLAVQPTASAATVSASPSVAPSAVSSASTAIGTAAVPVQPTSVATPTSVSPPPTPPATQPPAGPAILAQGQFRDGAPGHNGSGTAKLGRDANGKLFLVFENFSVTNGPDLRVILGTSDAGGGSGLDLGALKATDGNFSYAIPDGTDVSRFRSVTIWCKAFPTIFAVATLGAGS